MKKSHHRSPSGPARVPNFYRSLAFQNLHPRQLMVADAGVEQPIDLHELTFEVGDRAIVVSDQSPAVLQTISGEPLRIAGLKYDVDEAVTELDGVIAFESYIRRADGSIEHGVFDYTDGRFADPVSGALTGGRSFVHPGFEEAWESQLVDNRLVVLAIRYFGDQSRIEDRMIVDLFSVAPEGTVPWEQSLTSVGGHVTTEPDSATIQSTQAETRTGIAIVAEQSAPGYRFEVAVSSATAEDTRFANGFVVLDYRSPDDFVYAGLRAHEDQWVIGRFDGDFNDLATGFGRIDPDRRYDLRVAVDGDTVALAADGVWQVSHTFDSTLGFGKIGLANQFAKTQFSHWSVSDHSDLDVTWEALNKEIDRVEVEVQRAAETAKRSLEIADELRSEANELQDRAKSAIERYEEIQAARREAQKRKDRSTFRKLLEQEQHARKDAKSLYRQWQAAVTAADHAQENAENATTDFRHAQAEFDHLINHRKALEIAREAQARSAERESDDSKVYSVNFNDQDAGAFNKIQANFALVAGQLHLDGGSEVALALLDDESLPEREATRFYTTVRADAFDDRDSNGFFVFDFQSTQDFKYARQSAHEDQWSIGEFVDGVFRDRVVLEEVITDGKTYDMQLWLDQNRVGLLVNGDAKLMHVFDDDVNDGVLGLGNHRARSRFDQVAVMDLHGADWDQAWAGQANGRATVVAAAVNAL